MFLEPPSGCVMGRESLEIRWRKGKCLAQRGGSLLHVSPLSCCTCMSLSQPLAFVCVAVPPGFLDKSTVGLNSVISVKLQLPQ